MNPLPSRNLEKLFWVIKISSSLPLIVVHNDNIDGQHRSSSTNKTMPKNMKSKNIIITTTWEKHVYRASLPKVSFSLYWKTRRKLNNSELKQRRRRRQPERHKTMRLMSQNNTLHVRFTFWYISLPSSAKQNVEWPNLRFSRKRERMTASFSFVFFALTPFTVI